MIQQDKGADHVRFLEPETPPFQRVDGSKSIHHRIGDGQIEHPLLERKTMHRRSAEMKGFEPSAEEAQIRLEGVGRGFATAHRAEETVSCDVQTGGRVFQRSSAEQKTE